MGRRPADHEFQVPGVQGHAELGFRGKGQDVPGILLGSAFNGRRGRSFGGRCGKMFTDSVIEPVIEAALPVDKVTESRFQAPRRISSGRT